MARIRAASLENDRVMEDPETLASGHGWRRAWALRVGFFDGLLARGFFRCRPSCSPRCRPSAFAGNGMEHYRLVRSFVI
jgi:hypothetical protein